MTLRDIRRTLGIGIIFIDVMLTYILFPFIFVGLLSPEKPVYFGGSLLAAVFLAYLLIKGILIGFFNK